MAGLRLASDMVPNHMGIDSNWVIENPDWFLSRWESPFPAYTFEGPDLSADSRVEIKIEDHYYDHSDAAVVFRLRRYREGDTRYIYHGNDGTMFAWNDTAQLDYSKADVREHVIQVILNVARRFPIIRFDAAMVLAKRHVQRLWFPLPGAGGSIPSRAENAMSEEAFDALMPREFWREVVDRVAAEVPGTLLLAEAFWLLEGYFVRTLGMHRVYNSAFMNMLRDEENAKYRSYLKKTVEFDPDILKRYVNFMSNPDERTAIDQFGSGDKYFGVSVLLATLPGLPMFGHGQIEGYTERYGMDFKQARLRESANEGLIARHQEIIAPLLKNRQLFAESTNFVLYDFWTGYGKVNENVFAYSNTRGDQRAIILYNNSYGSTHGTIHISVGFLEKQTGRLQQKSLADGLRLPHDGTTIIAYRDKILGLEYLRRASAFRDQGLTLDLRGYQHVVLLDWRELRPSWSEPWDRLCDALHGSGVHSVDEALSQLRLRPIVDALHQVICDANVQAFSDVARELDVRSQKPEKSSKSSKLRERKNEQTAKYPPASAENLKADFDPRLAEFIREVQVFAKTAVGLAQSVTGKNTSVASDLASGSALSKTSKRESREQKEDFAEIAAASVHVPSMLAAFPEALQAAARSVLPTSEAEVSAPAVWPPILAWIALRAFPSPASSLAIYDELRLRHALAETFSTVGLHGEQTWRAAAMVRVLLRMNTESSPEAVIRSKEFWHDPDVHWLAGISDSAGKEYLNREQFEALICWLQLPALIEIAKGPAPFSEAAGGVAATAVGVTRAAKAAGYDLRLFLDLLRTETTTDKSEPGTKSFSTPPEPYTV